MKVVVAGFCKTGTKTVAEALRNLGLNVYDYEENVYLIGEEWTKILTSGGTVDDFRRMYKDVDAVTDVPACYFWQEIHEAYPEAKIILMTRQNEDVWLKSIKKQIEAVNSHWILIYLSYLSPTKYRVHRLGVKICQTIYGSAIYDPWPFNYEFNATVLRKVYRMHNSHVLQSAPKDKLLVYDVRQGWKPLCDFLDKKVPQLPFPHKNVDGEILTNMLELSPMIRQIKKEVTIALSLLSIGASFLCFWLFR